MAAAAEIGALRVNLAMNAGEFEEGAKDASGALDKFALKIGLTAGIAAAAAEKIIEWIEKAMTAVITGLQAGVDRMTQFADTADDLGVSIETISAIATQSRVGVDALAKGLKELNQNMVDLASGDVTSKAARSFTALGVSVQDANGGLRNTEDVLSDIADKLLKYEDGLAKSALAQNLFGDAGADMLDVVKDGAAGLDELKDKAEETGIVFTKELGEAAQGIRDNIADLGKGFETFSNRLAILVVPVIGKLVQKLADTAEGSTLAVDLANLMANAFHNVVASAMRTIATIEILQTNFAMFVRNIASFTTGAWTEIEERNRVAAARIEKINGDLNFAINEMFTNAKKEQEKAAAEHKDKVAAPIIASVKSITEAQSEWNRSVAAGVALVEKLKTPYEIQAKQLDQLGDAYDAGKISAEQLARAQQASTFIAQNAYASMASNIAGTLEKVFSGNKAVAIASALINTYEAVTKALATYPPPFSFVAAGAALAAGLVQVANIRKTSKTSTGGGGGSVGSPAVPAEAGVGVQQSLLVQGINPGDIFTGDVMKSIATKLLEFQRDGGKVVFA